MVDRSLRFWGTLIWGESELEVKKVKKVNGRRTV